MSNDSQESISSRPRLYPSVLTQMQIERLKREDEEEHWISGEELYTEGSSDDEDDQRLIGDPSELRSTENIRTNIYYSAGGQPGANRSCRLGHQGLPRSQITTGGLLQVHEKSKIDETAIDSSCSSVTPRSAAIQSTSEEKLSSYSSSPSSGRNAEEIADYPSATDLEKENEISWRPKRDNSAIVELRELQLEYNEIQESLRDLKTSLTSLNFNSGNGNSRNRNNYENEINVERLAEIFSDNEEGEKLESKTSVDDSFIEDISFISDQDVYRWSNAIINTAKLKKEIVKMMKLDTCIELLNDKVKKANEERLREQILNRKELRKLQNLRNPESGRLAKNSESFFKLCATMEINTESVEDRDISTNHSKNLRNNDEESLKSQKEKLEEELKIIEQRKVSFIEKNKELASCAMGTLAITDEEKKRLEELVDDDDDDDDDQQDLKTDERRSSLSATSSSTPYTIDKEADELLKDLTEQLANLNSETYRKSEENRSYDREEFLPHKEQLVLHSLRTLAESSSKIIHPISEDEMRQLINEYYAEQEACTSRSRAKEFSNDTKSAEIKFTRIEIASETSENPSIPQDVIDELVNEAKTTMPLFQFKHQIDSIEDLQDEEENRKLA